MNQNFLDNIDIEQIKRAINVEEKYKYIDILGRETSFSGFILKQLRQIYKLSSKNPKWLPLIEAFEHYSMENILQRKKTISRLISLLKSELKEKKENTENTFVQSSDDNIYLTDVIALKGVGPKFGYLLNKIGIFSVFDLISYYPKRYIDYSSRAFIRDLKLGQNVTIYGRIISTKMGYLAVQLLSQGIGNRVIAVKDDEIVDYDIFEALNMTKTLDLNEYNMALRISM